MYSKITVSMLFARCALTLLAATIVPALASAGPQSSGGDQSAPVKILSHQDSLAVSELLQSQGATNLKADVRCRLPQLTGASNEGVNCWILVTYYDQTPVSFSTIILEGEPYRLLTDFANGMETSVDSSGGRRVNFNIQCERKYFATPASEGVNYQCRIDQASQF